MNNLIINFAFILFWLDRYDFILFWLDRYEINILTKNYSQWLIKKNLWFTILKGENTFKYENNFFLTLKNSKFIILKFWN